jgi:hypothetical protein
MTTRQRTTAPKTAPTVRLAAFALALALSAFTLGAAMPGGAAYVAGRILPDAGDAFETIAMHGDATEVEILPGTIEVVGVRTHRTAADALPANRG